MKNLYIQNIFTYKNIYKIRLFRLQILNYIELNSDASYLLQCRNINYANIKFISFIFIFIIILKIIFYNYFFKLFFKIYK